MPTPERSPRRLFPALLLVGFALAFGFGLWRAAAPASGPVEVPWDRVACAHCRMLVSDPRFAAQRHEANGTVLFYDDPGCALLDAAAHPGPGQRTYFHDSRGPGWLREAEVAFVPVPESPMGYGFAAIARGSDPAALPPEQLLARLQAGAATPREPRP